MRRPEKNKRKRATRAKFEPKETTMEADDIEQDALYDATVRIRRNLGLEVKPEAEKLDGRRVRVRAMFQCFDGETYPGEIAMAPEDPFLPEWRGVSWVASGDLVDMVEVSEGTGVRYPGVAVSR